MTVRRSARNKQTAEVPPKYNEESEESEIEEPQVAVKKPRKSAAKPKPADQPLAKADQTAKPATKPKAPAKKKTATIEKAPVQEEKRSPRKIRPEEHCPRRDEAFVYQDFHCLLNQTNISQNNNKFYIIQLLHFEQESRFAVWTRWGRVGEQGQSNMAHCSSEQSAIDAFRKKFHDKTKNHWGQHPFQHYAGKYDMLERDLDGFIAEDEEEDQVDDQVQEDSAVVKIKSKLDQRLQSLIKLIFNQKMMSETMQSIGYDTRKMPLGKMTKDHIQRGFDVLNQIADVLDKPGFDAHSTLEQLSSRFYTIIPHDFGRQRPPVINTPQALKSKLQMVESLGDIEIATSIMKKADAMAEQVVHPLDMYYSKLNNSLSPIDRESHHWTIIEEYVAKTHASTHSQYGLKVVDIFETDRSGEQPYRIPSSSSPDDSGHWLLWHGSRLTNFVGILSQGLRIAPPEAPSTGYMFGKGIYFADMVSKSANYCFASKSSSTGLLLLCEVYLGKQVDLLHADYNADKIVESKQGHSTKGCGSTCPDPSELKHVEFDGRTVKVPAGKPTAAQLKDKGSLLYNEYIVYKVEQVKMRYVVQVKFDFK